MAFAAGAHANCPIVIGEPKIEFRVAEGSRQVELRVLGVAATEAPFCILQLACEVRPEPQNMAYALRRGSIATGDIVAVEFYFPDGSIQACRVTEARVPR